MQILRAILAKFDYEIDGKKLTIAKAAIEDYKKALEAVGEKGKELSIGNLKSWAADIVKEVGGAAAGIRRAAAVSGLGIEEVQQWGFAGLGPEALSKAMRGLSKTLAGVEDGTKSSTKTFQKLGISALDAEGNARPMAEVFQDVGFALADLDNPAQRAALGQRVFGKAWGDVAATFAKGRDGLAALNAKFKELGGGLSEKAIANTKRLSIAQKEQEFALLGLKGELAAGLAPALEKSAQLTGRFAAWLRETSERSNIFRVAGVALGGVLVAAALKSYAAWLPWIALALGVALVLDDVVTGLEGGKSAWGQFLEGAYGPLGENALANIRKMWSDGGYRAALAFALGFGAFIAQIWERPAAATVGGLARVGRAVQDWIDEKFGSWSELFAQLGTSVLDGFVGGFVDAIPHVIEKFEELADKATQVFKDKLKISSPSRVFADLGAEIPAGLAIGIRDGTPEAAAATAGALGSAAAGAGGPGMTLQQTNRFEIHTTAPTTSEAIRDGVEQGLDLSWDAALAYFEPSVGT